MMVRLTVNGAVYERDVEPRLLLSDFIRNELSLTGTHVGCEHGVCGACTVFTADVRAREREFVTDEVAEEQSWFDVALVHCPVHGEPDDHVSHSDRH